MNDVKQYSSLENWLAVAAGALCESSRERVRAEYEAHYWSAYNDEKKSGRSNDTAQAAALTALGDPQKIRRQLQREHFTQNDVQILRHVNGMWLFPRFLMISVAALVLLSLTGYLSYILIFTFIDLLSRIENIGTLSFLYILTVPIFIILSCFIFVLFVVLYRFLSSRMPPVLSLFMKSFANFIFILCCFLSILIDLFDLSLPSWINWTVLLFLLSHALYFLGKDILLIRKIARIGTLPETE